jgi:hypothetical protein
MPTGGETLQQLTINLPSDVMSFVQAAADREVRPVALQIRYFLTEAMRAENAAQAAGAVPRKAHAPGPAVTWTGPGPAAVAARAARHAELIARLGKLEAIKPVNRAAAQDSEIDEIKKELWQVEQTASRYADPPLPGTQFAPVFVPLNGVNHND